MRVTGSRKKAERVTASPGGKGKKREYKGGKEGKGRGKRYLKADRGEKERVWQIVRADRDN